MDLQAELEKVVGQAEFISELNKDLKEVKQAHPLFQEVEDTKKALAQKRAEMEADEAIVEIKEQLATARERLSLLKEVLVARMQEEEVEEVSTKSKKASMVKTMKIEKIKSL